ncbi:ATP-dependent RNA helicase ddx53 [Plakobranchus ocellatus]|uniref:RNA helicase n=1 Tax=Plakobranchus ocellatus TaxID=259542 RepID=A0AAV4DJH8_9GAST|nr:ATP-dependent RNA helicase ddx53 [Plakobranchus ocellatus]
MSYRGGFNSRGGDGASTMMVESSNVGKIIGRGGCKIKELEQDGNVRIKVSREEDEHGMKSVEISGAPEDIEHARRLIEDCLSGNDFGGRRGYGQGNRRRDDGGGWGRRDRDGGDGYRRRDDYDRGYSNNRGGRGGGGFGGEGGDSETVYVESSEVGRIIGRGGNRIRDLEAESGCRIKVSKDGDSYGRSSVELSGTLESISEAKRLIQDAGVDIKSENDHSRGGFDQDRLENNATANGHTPEVTKRIPIDWNALREQKVAFDKQKFEGLPPIKKDFYEEDDHIAHMSSEEVKQIRRQNNNIIVDAPDGDSKSVPNPIKTFEDAFQRYPLILEQIYNQQFEKPSPIQCQAWPILMQGKDLIGIAQTGTGKTLAFLLPALIHIDNQPVPRSQRNGPSALVLSPTRELAQQIETEVNKINYRGIRREQLEKVKSGVEIVVATPGRLNDFMMNGIIHVKHVTYLVMDEADRMLDLGFELEIKKVMLDIRPDRQTVMTSATWPPAVQEMADRYMTDPYKVFVGTLDLAAVHSVGQTVELVEEYEKKSMLMDFIHQMAPDEKVIVFVGKKIIADDVSSDLAMNDIICQCIHGDREQCDREAALEEFKDSSVKILVATDVASRGLDVKDITHVINYDFPRHIEEYVHRIGRTGRAGRSGTAITFVTRQDWKHAQNLIDIMAEANQEIPDDLLAMAERYSAFKRRQDSEGGFGGRGRGRGRGGRGGGGFGRRRDDDFESSDGWF